MPAPTSTPTLRLDWVDAAKGVSIVLVVLTHVFYWMDAAHIDATSPFKADTALSQMRMPLFFFASGLFAASYLTGTWARVIAKKLVLLTWVFVAWLIIGIGYSIAAGLLIHESDAGGTVVRAILKLAVSLLRPSSELWFLWALVILLVVGRALWRWRGILITVAAAASVAVAALPADLYATLHDLVGVGWVGLARYAVVFYAAGWLGKSGAQRIANAPAWAVVAWGLIGGAIMFSYPFVDLGPAEFVYLPAGIASGLAASRLLARFKVLRSIGQTTLPIFVMHTTLIVAATILLLPARSFINAVPGFDYVLPLLLTAAVLAVATVTYRGLAGTVGAHLFAPPAFLYGRIASWQHQERV